MAGVASNPCKPPATTVTSSADGGPGALRPALAYLLFDANTARGLQFCRDGSGLTGFW